MNQPKLTFFATFFSIFLIFFWANASLAQCPVGDVFLGNQTQVNSYVTNYSTCTTISGFLKIQQVGTTDLITDISGLSSLTTINGELLVRDNSGLSSMVGLDSVSTVGGALTIRNNDNVSFTSLTGLAGLISVGANVFIYGNDNLANVNALSSLTTMSGELRIESNPALTSLSGLDGINKSGITSIKFGANATLATCHVASVCAHLAASGTATVWGNTGDCATVAKINTACAALPIILSNFDASQEKGQVYLSWITSSEYNNKGFNIQRSSDGRRWDDIAFVEGVGDASVDSKYAYIDEKAKMGVNYYRLEQIDYDGQVDYSEMVNVKIEHKLGVLVYPNPSKGLLYFSKEHEGVRLIDSRGRVVLEANNTSQLDMSRLPTGIYHLMMIDAGSVLVKKIVLEK